MNIKISKTVISIILSLAVVMIFSSCAYETSSGYNYNVDDEYYADYYDSYDYGYDSNYDYGYDYGYDYDYNYGGYDSGYSFCNFCNGLGETTCDVCYGLGYKVIDVPNYGGGYVPDEKIDCSRCFDGEMDCPHC